MRTLIAVLIGIVLLSAETSLIEPSPPTVKADTVTTDTVTIGEVRGSPEALLVRRPVGARGRRAKSSVFVVGADDVARRVAVEYGSASAPLIQIVSGVSRDRIIVSDMRAWDAFERLRLR